jgi:hypothetical protein
MVSVKRWSKEKAEAWYKKQGWICGVNYIPSNAINYTAMWDPTSFSPKLIDKELALAESIGMNCVRVVLQYAVYEKTPKAFVRNFEKFLTICKKHHIKAIPIFFDDCAFGVNKDPVAGKQVEPLLGWYAWAWSPSPGHTMVIDQRYYPKLEIYVKDIMLRYKNDERILLWDLYNEPSNSSTEVYSMPLLKKVFLWARDVNPSQPISSCWWMEDRKIIGDYGLQNSDIITFHCYRTKIETDSVIKNLKTDGRPIICTEWMHRLDGSTIEELLPYFKEKNIGNLLWGLVNGKTQTHLPWFYRPEMLPYKGVWQHDIFTPEFKPYKIEEIELIKKFSNNKMYK